MPIRSSSRTGQNFRERDKMFANGTKCSRTGSVRGWDGTYIYLRPPLLHDEFPILPHPPSYLYCNIYNTKKPSSKLVPCLPYPVFTPPTKTQPLDIWVVSTSRYETPLGVSPFHAFKVHIQALESGWSLPYRIAKVLTACVSIVTASATRPCDLCV